MTAAPRSLITAYLAVLARAVYELGHMQDDAPDAGVVEAAFNNPDPWVRALLEHRALSARNDWRRQYQDLLERPELVRASAPQRFRHRPVEDLALLAVVYGNGANDLTVDLLLQAWQTPSPLEPLADLLDHAQTQILRDLEDQAA